MKRIRDTLEFAAGWLYLNPAERAIIAGQVRTLRRRNWALYYLAPILLIG